MILLFKKLHIIYHTYTCDNFKPTTYFQILPVWFKFKFEFEYTIEFNFKISKKFYHTIITINKSDINFNINKLTYSLWQTLTTTTPHS